MKDVQHCRWCGAIIRRVVLGHVGDHPIIRWSHPPGRREVCIRIREHKDAREAMLVFQRQSLVQRALPFGE